MHLFTIKGRKYGLTHDHPEFHLKDAVDEAGEKHTMLNAGDFRDDLVLAKEAYFADVENTPELLEKAVQRYNRDGFLGPVPIIFR